MSDDYLFDCANAEYLDDLSNEELQAQLADANKKVAELEAENKELDQFLTDACNERDEYAKRAEGAEAENKRLAARDCNATVQLCTPTDDNPWDKEECAIVDVGVSDNTYVVESKTLTEEQAKREDLEKRVKAVHRLYEMQVQAAVKLNERLSTSEAMCQVLAEEVDTCPTGITTDKCINISYPHDDKLCVKCRLKQAREHVKEKQQ